MNDLPMTRFCRQARAISSAELSLAREKNVTVCKGQVIMRPIRLKSRKRSRAVVAGSSSFRSLQHRAERLEVGSKYYICPGLQFCMLPMANPQLLRRMREQVAFGGYSPDRSTHEK